MKLFLVVLLFSMLASCGHTLTVRTIPPGARVYIEGDFCISPCEKHYAGWDVPPYQKIHIEHEGYRPVDDVVRRRLANRTFFSWPIAGLPFWINGPFDLDPETKDYELIQIDQKEEPLSREDEARMQRLNSLHDKKLITDDEYRNERTRILKGR